MLEKWLLSLEDARTNPEVRVIVMTGTGRAFTTGGDVDGFSASAKQTAAGIRKHLVDGVQRLPRKLAEIDKPVIAALNGFARRWPGHRAGLRHPFRCRERAIRRDLRQDGLDSRSRRRLPAAAHRRHCQSAGDVLEQ
jgi:hypothetical protein